MSRYTGPKHRLERQEGESLDLKSLASKSRDKRLNVPPGQHGQKGRKKKSDYAVQLRAKQKAKRMYGLSEKQFHRYFEIGKKEKGKTGDVLLQMLEMRLDNVIFRLGLAPTRAAARQLVSHGHVSINNQKINIPSYQVKLNQVLTVDSKAKAIQKEHTPPVWLAKQGAAGKIVKVPERADIETTIDDQLIVEFYSR